MKRILMAIIFTTICCDEIYDKKIEDTVLIDVESADWLIAYFEDNEINAETISIKTNDLCENVQLYKQITEDYHTGICFRYIYDCE